MSVARSFFRGSLTSVVLSSGFLASGGLSPAAAATSVITVQQVCQQAGFAYPSAQCSTYGPTAVSSGCLASQSQLPAGTTAVVSGSGDSTICTVTTPNTVTVNPTVTPSSTTAVSSIQSQILATTATQITRSGNVMIQSQMNSIRDRLQGVNRAAGFAPPQGLGMADKDSSDKPMYLSRGEPEQKRIGSWAQGYADYEARRDNPGFLDGRNTNVSGVIGGTDYMFTRLFSPGDAFVWGVLGGYTDARVKSLTGLTSTNVNGGAVGTYGVYVNGAYSWDFNFKTDFLSVDQSVGGVNALSADLTSYTIASNISYKWFAPRSVGGWIEPTAGIMHSWTNWGNGQSALDSRLTRVQAGLRIGDSFRHGGIIIEPTLTGLFYSDVEISGGNFVGVGQPPTDEGKLFASGGMKLNFDLGGGLSTSIEGDARVGANTDAQVWGVNGRAGLRYQW